MKFILLAALLFGATSFAASALSPPLCQVTATLAPSPLPWLTSIRVRLKPECPPGSFAQVRLLSTLGSTDPPDSWLILTPCLDARDTCTCAVTFRGVLLRPLGWRPQWRADSGRAYDVPIRP